MAVLSLPLELEGSAAGRDAHEEKSQSLVSRRHLFSSSFEACVFNVLQFGFGISAF